MKRRTRNDGGRASILRETQREQQLAFYQLRDSSFHFSFFFLDFFPPSFVSDQLICYSELPKMETAESDQM